MNWNDEDDAHKDIDELTTFSTFKKSIRDHAPVSKEYEMSSQYKLRFPNCALMCSVLGNETADLWQEGDKMLLKIHRTPRLQLYYPEQEFLDKHKDLTGKRLT